MNNLDPTTTSGAANANGHAGGRQAESTFNDQTGNFTAELCQFLTSLAKTPDDQYEDLSFHLTRLREALLIEVDTEAESDSRSKRSSESSSEGNIHNLFYSYSYSYSILSSLLSDSRGVYFVHKL